MRFLIFIFFFSSSSFASLTEKILGQVGEEVLSHQDVMSLRKKLQKDVFPTTLLFSTTFKKSRLLNNKKQRLEFLISLNMLKQMAEKNPLLQISPSQINKMYKKIRGKRSRSSFTKTLKSIGSSPEDLKEDIEKVMLADQALLFFVGSRIKVSNEEIETWYKQKHKKDFFNSMEYEFISLQLTEKEKNLALKKIKDNKNYDLEKLALDLNLETETLTVPKEKLNSKIKKELEKLMIFKTSPFFQVRGNWYLVKLLWKNKISYPQDMEKRAQIEGKVYKEKRKALIKAWLTKEKKDYPIIRN